MFPADNASVLFTRYVDTDASRAAILSRGPSSCYVAIIQRHKVKGKGHPITGHEGPTGE
jgi:hypothetical protein